MRALADLQEYKAQVQASGTSGEALRRVEGVVLRLADFPNSGRPGRRPGIRELVVPRTPYVVEYRVEVEAVVIVSVRRGGVPHDSEL
ncbi:type II toxin-antitoxin system RelE/ParE family toxin [Gloeobacter morelensis]|uniref:type II toxin-antitoxin system RelE/ParE family toxin n=1 Tax=Gloeobacter morelensis TaxID=2907343 RepID=UPI00211AE248|nr:type II toxin-antitoxin system RelE/ParE family toxin [Gloeobacter morelensis]